MTDLTYYSIKLALFYIQRGFSPCKGRVVFSPPIGSENLHPFSLAFRNSAGADLSPSRSYSKRGTSEVSLLYPLYLPNRQFSRSKNCSCPNLDTQSGASPSWLTPIHPSLHLPPQNEGRKREKPLKIPYF